MASDDDAARRAGAGIEAGPRRSCGGTVVVRLVDLDDASGLERAWQELEKRRQIRALNPKLRADVERAVHRALTAGGIDEAEAQAIQGELDEAHPSIVLAAHWKELTPNHSALGAFAPAAPPTRVVPYGPNNWLREDPSRLAAVVIEISRFCKDEPRVAEAVLDQARRLGIEEDLAVGVIVKALVRARHDRGGKGRG